MLHAGTGDPPRMRGLLVTPADTAGTTDNPSDTSQFVSSVVDEDPRDTATDDGDPTKKQPSTSAAVADSSDNSDGMEDMIGGDFYDDFDTTIVHADKFDALSFDDTIYIPLNDPAHNPYCHPFNGRPTSSFGFRSYRYHFGVDIDLETGDSVKCAFDGKVRIAQHSKSYGYVVVVRHNNGLETYYAHLSKLLVHPGEDVNAGTILGLGGNTGHSHGSHLHFEVRFGGQPINPNYLIDFDKKQLRTDTYCLCKSDFKYLTETYRVRHYSRKKKKTWYTYYCPGGARYSTPQAKAVMAKVPPPVMPGTTPKPFIAPVVSDSVASTTTKADNSVSKPAHTTTASSPPAKKTTTAKPAAKKTSPPPKNSATASSGKVFYTVKKGDTLSGIAVRYGTSVQKICDLNGIKSSTVLQIGRKLRVK
ncbi:MAG TPA: peptidoglycan DD-metalloendopeptidase family protein [Bacteroidia bacterium]|nr:peptidoglycan DD-metalloendopeptidase family protein [Bacteroidia bacterium]